MTDRMNPDSQPADATVLLIREGVIHAEQLTRYYLHLAHRFRRLGALLGFAVVGGSLVALFTIVSPLPNWVPLTVLGIVTATILFTATMRFEKKAVFSGDLYRQMQQLSSDWSDLFSEVGRLNDEELRQAWRSLTRRQCTALLYSPVELPLSDRLMRRCRREAVEYWAERLNGLTVSETLQQQIESKQPRPN